MEPKRHRGRHKTPHTWNDERWGGGKATRVEVSPISLNAESRREGAPGRDTGVKEPGQRGHPERGLVTFLTIDVRKRVIDGLRECGIRQGG